MKYLLKLSYLGTSYCGFQVQKNGKTVQGELCRASDEIFGGKCLVTGCSRTDSGVHAREYYATLASCGDCSAIPAKALPLALASKLPDDISVSDAWLVPDDFSVRRAVKCKEYMYLIYTSKTRNPFLGGRAYFYPHEPDISLINKAAEFFVGRHDFRAFMASGSEITETVRTVSGCFAEKDGDSIKIFVSADGFLYNMVRIIVGTLLEVSEGKIKADEIPEIISSLDRKKSGRTAPAQGLYLNRVFINFAEGRNE